MTVKELLTEGGGILLVILTLIQIAPIKLDPWTAIARAIGKTFNGEVMDKLEHMEMNLQETRRTLDDHIRMDDERNADEHRSRILRFNNELLRNLPHTKEEFIDVLADIDSYEKFCGEHPDYKNNRATHAIGNISRCYDERMQKHDFL